MTETQLSADKFVSLSACIVIVAEDGDKSAFAKPFTHYTPLLRAFRLAQARCHKDVPEKVQSEQSNILQPFRTLRQCTVSNRTQHLLLNKIIRQRNITNKTFYQSTVCNRRNVGACSK